MIKYNFFHKTTRKLERNNENADEKHSIAFYPCKILRKFFIINYQQNNEIKEKTFHWHF